MADVRELQRSLNRFTSKYLKGVKPLRVDGEKGKGTNRRIMTVKWYLGYGKDRDGSVKPLFVRRMRHPHSVRYSNPKMLAVGAARRRRQRKHASSPPASASDREWGGSREFTNRAIRVAAARGVPVSSRKRSVAIGGNMSSDHNVWNRNADAVDLATFEGADDAHAIAREFGIQGYQTGNYTGYHVRGKSGALYRIQILWAVQGHYDHVHVGARRA